MNILELLAATSKIDPGEIGYHPTVTNAGTGLSNILTLVYAAAGIAAVIVIIVAGVIFITSNDNAQKISRAKNAIMGAVAGLVIIIMAFAITQFVIGSI